MKRNLLYFLTALLITALAIGACVFIVSTRIPVQDLFARSESSEPTETAAPAMTSDAPTARTTDAETSEETLSILESIAGHVVQQAEPVVTTATLVAVGDNLIHNMVYNSGMGTNPWNYDHLYAQVRPEVEAADLAIINQETIFVQNHENISNYPVFGTPREIGDAVYKAGFDVILHASNHALDKGVDNIYDAIDYWSDKDVTVLGIHKDQQDADTPKIVEVNGIRMGLLNYTYGLNGFLLPAGQEYAVDLLDYEQKLMRDIAYCEEHADITIGFWHMGIEYMTVPSDEQKGVVEKTVAAGCDLLICCHPHCLQPYEMYTAANGNQALVYYSLGNFISAQDRVDSLLGGMATVTLQMTVRGTERSVEIIDYDLKPLVTHVNYGTNFTTYYLKDYSDYLGAYNVLCPVTTSQLWDRFYTITGHEKIN